jgi:hypothetical protein
MLRTFLIYVILSIFYYTYVMYLSHNVIILVMWIIVIDSLTSKIQIYEPISWLGGSYLPDTWTNPFLKSYHFETQNVC